MKKSVFYLSILALMLTRGPGFDANAQEKAYHVFTSKKGQAIEATPMLVTPDKTKLGIRRKDGREFEIPILTLSLDDQQFIKEWLKKNPVKMDFNGLSFFTSEDVISVLS